MVRLTDRLDITLIVMTGTLNHKTKTNKIDGYELEHSKTYKMAVI